MLFRHQGPTDVCRVPARATAARGVLGPPLVWIVLLAAALAGCGDRDDGATTSRRLALGEEGNDSWQPPPSAPDPGRHIQPKPGKTEIRKGNELDHVIVVKLVEGSRIRWRQTGYDFEPSRLTNEDLKRLGRQGLGAGEIQAGVVALKTILADAGVFTPEPAFSAKEDVIEQQRLEGEARTGAEMSDLSLYTHWIADPLVTDPTTTASLIDRLNALPIVEIAYPHYVPALPQVRPPAAPDLVSSQRYLNAAPEGIDARYAWTVPGGRGAGVRIVDAENAWIMDHEDFPPVFWGGNSLIPFIPDLSYQHGTAVVGVLAAANNGAGVLGIVHEAAIGLSTNVRASFWPVPDSINSGAAVLRAGDVLLVEAHSRGPSTGYPCGLSLCETWEYIAQEYWPADFDAIRNASARGVVVVEAGGNGGMNLDHPRYGRLFDRAFRNSGAILVGAGMPFSREAYDWSSSGSRVDLQGWGGGVSTMGYGGAGLRFSGTDSRGFYTNGFGGTSSATPIVAGAVGSIQGVLRARGRAPLNGTQIADVLRRTGQPQGMATVASQPIGPLPNLHWAIPDALQGVRLPFPVGPNAYYYLLPQFATWKAVDLAGGDLANNADIWSWDYIPGNRNQHWALVSDGDGYFEIRSRVSNKCMEVYGFSLGDGGDVRQWDCWSGDNQKWRVAPLPAEPPFYALFNKASGKALDVTGGWTGNGVNVIQWGYHDGGNQKFMFQPTP